MIKVLFDFEIDEHLRPLHSPQYYEAIRAFFLEFATRFELEIRLYVAANDYAVIIIFVSDTEIKTAPFNIPDHLMMKINSCITENDRNLLQERLSSIKEGNEFDNNRL